MSYQGHFTIHGLDSLKEMSLDGDLRGIDLGGTLVQTVCRVTHNQRWHTF